MEMAGQIINGLSALFTSYFTIIRSLFSKGWDSIRRQEKYEREKKNTPSKILRNAETAVREQ